jgi:hypothetical protein
VGALERARQDVAAGRLWKARDRLLGAAVARGDDELLALLGEVQFAMHDLPAAGAAWFATGRSDAEARRAEEAWRERHGNVPLQLWMSLPGRARYRDDERSRELREVAGKANGRPLPDVPPPGAAAGGGGVGCAVLGILALLVVVICFGVGASTILRWAFS